MKLTNKILLASFGLVLIATTALALKLTSVVEYTPQPMKESFIGFAKSYSRINELEISGGYNVEVFKSDKDSLDFFGPDLLVKKHSIIEEKNGKLKIESKVNLAHYPFFLRIKIYAKNLESISAKNGVTLNIWNMEGDLLKVSAKDSSIVKVSGSKYKYARLDANDRAIISVEKTTGADVSIKDQGMIVVNVGSNGLSGSKTKEATLIANGKIVDQNVLVSEAHNTRMVKK